MNNRQIEIYKHFLNIQLNTETIDVFVPRKAILEAINNNLHIFKETILDIGCGQMPYRELIFSKKHGQAESSAFVDTSIYLLRENNKWLYDQEFFAPLLVVIPFQNQKEAVALANATQFGLGASVWSEDLERADLVAQGIVAGQVSINDIVKSDMTLPFGGFKKSGLGRELGALGLLEFTQSKVISYS